MTQFLNLKIVWLYAAWFVPFTIIAPVVIGFFKYHVLSSPLRILTWYLSFSAVLNIITVLLAGYQVNNLPLLHFYTLTEFILLMVFFKRIFSSHKIERYFLPLIIAFSLLCIINAVYFQSLFTYNSYTKTAEAIIVCFFSAKYFFVLLDGIDKITPAKKSLIYINTGLLLYFSCSFIIFVLYKNGIMSWDMSLFIWSIHATFLLLMYILFAIGLWKYKV